MGIPVSLSGGIDSSLLVHFVKPRFVISVQLPGGKKYNEIKYSRKVAKWFGVKHIIIRPNKRNFNKYTKEAVKAIGRPIPHFNIYPLYCMFKKLNEMGETRLITGDGPDETMCGYARNIMMKHLYFNMFNEHAFEGYGSMLGRVLKPFEEAYAEAIGKRKDVVKRIFDEEARKGKNAIDCMCKIDMEICRKDMDDMGDGIANYFGIKAIRPYQDNKKVDNFMYNLSIEDKVTEFYGKYLLRKIAAKYLPKDIAWRKRKVGGPVYPVNKIKGWVKTDGEFGKTSWLNFQKDILNGEIK